jgi:arginine N-succinyltransferase
MRMLENEGFAYESYVDIFDGGPTMTAHTDNVASVRDAVSARVTSTALDKGEKVLLAAGRLDDFRCSFGLREVAGDGIAIDPDSAALLGLGVGDEVWSIAR